VTERAFSRIIVILDGGPGAERAIPVASALARQAQLPLTLVRVVPDGDSGDEADAYLRARQAEVAGVTDRAVLRGVPVADAIVDFLARHARALLCCTTHARSGLGELILGSVAEDLMRRSPVPVLLVGPGTPLPSGGGRYRTLVLCVEDDAIDAATARLLPVAERVCVGANLHPWLFQVLEPSGPAPSDQDDEPNGAGQLPRLTKALVDAGLPAQQLVSHATDVPEAISFFAGTLTGPIVALSSRRRSLSERLREGSVAVGVARTAPCPVLVVGPSCRSHEELPGHAQTTT